MFTLNNFFVILLLGIWRICTKLVFAGRIITPETMVLTLNIQHKGISVVYERGNTWNIWIGMVYFDFRNMYSMDKGNIYDIIHVK